MGNVRSVPSLFFINAVQPCRRRSKDPRPREGDPATFLTVAADATQAQQDPSAKVQDVLPPVATDATPSAKLQDVTTTATADATQAPQDPSAKVQDVTGSSTS